MAHHSENGELRTAIPLLVPLWLLAILTGVVLTFSTFLGGTLGIAVVAMLIYCLWRMQTTNFERNKRISAKAGEAALLSALIPILGTASALSSLHFPSATITINVVLVSIALPHLVLFLTTSEKMNHFHLLSFASLVLIVNPVAFSFSEEGTFSTMLPFTTVTIFALTMLCRAIFLVREKISLRALKFAYLVLTVVCSIASVYFYMYDFPRFWRSLIETVTCTLLFGYLDFLQYQMRTRYGVWTEDTHCNALAHVSIKLCAVLSVAMWAGLGPLLNSGVSHHHSQSSTIGDKPKNSDFEVVVVFWGMAQCLIFIGYFAAKSNDRKQGPVREASASTNKVSKVAVGICGSVVVIALKISIACYYIFAYHPRSIPSIVLLLIIGILFLLLLHFLDDLRAVLLPYYGKLVLICVGLSVYTIASVIYLYNTAPPDDLPSGIPIPGTIYNASIRTIDIAKPGAAAEVELATLSSMFFKEGSADQEGKFERIRFPLARVCYINSLLLILLAGHFVATTNEESENKNQPGTAARASSPIRGYPAPRISSRSTQAAAAALVERDSDSDYHSVDNDLATRAIGRFGTRV